MVQFRGTWVCSGEGGRDGGGGVHLERQSQAAPQVAQEQGAALRHRAPLLHR